MNRLQDAKRVVVGEVGRASSLKQLRKIRKVSAARPIDPKGHSGTAFIPLALSLAPMLAGGGR